MKHKVDKKLYEEVEELKFETAREAYREMVGGDIWDGRRMDTVIKDVWNEAIESVLEKLK